MMIEDVIYNKDVFKS